MTLRARSVSVALGVLLVLIGLAGLVYVAEHWPTGYLAVASLASVAVGLFVFFRAALLGVEP